MRIRNHIRSNVIGYLALFFALTGSAVALDGSNTVFSDDIVNGEVKSADIGTAEVSTADIANNTVGAIDLAADSVDNTKIKNNDIRSGDIRNGNVETDDLLDGGVGTVDLADGSVNSAKVLDNSLTSNDLGTGSVGSDEVINESLTSSDLATDSVNATEVANDSIDSGEIVDFGLSNQDVGVLFAEVDAAGTLDNSSGGGVTTTKLGGLGNYEVDFARNVSFCTAVATIGPSGAGSAAGEINVADRSGNAEAVFIDTNDSAGAAADKPFRLALIC